MFLYKLSRNQTLEGSPEEIFESLLSEHREHLYRRNVVTLINITTGSPYRFYKCKTHCCPDCGTIHGSRIQLMPEAAVDFSRWFNPSQCPGCRAGIKLEPREWCKEFLEDGHEVASP